MNICVFTGNVASDPETRGKGGSVLAFRLAVNGREFDAAKGEWRDSTDYFGMVMFGKRAEAIGKFLAKGLPVTAQAHARQNTWTTDDGQNRSTVEFVVDDIQVGRAK